MEKKKDFRKLRSIEPFNNEPDKHTKFCVNCGKVATHIATFDVDGATVIERYCDTCVKSIKSK